MSEFDFDLKNPFTARVSEDEHKLNQERLKEIFCDIEPANLSNRLILNGLFDKALLKVRKNAEPRKEDLDKIRELTNEIGRLKTLIDFKEKEITDIKEASNEIAAQNNELKEKLEAATGEVQTVKSRIPADSSIILELSPKQKMLVETICERLTERFKQPIKPGKFLFHLCWCHYIKQESEPPFPYVIKSRDLQTKQSGDE